MARRQGDGGPFELIDPELTIYALANGMDLAKEADARRLGWYREGRERQIRIATVGGREGFSLVASAWRTGDEESRTDDALGQVASARELLERLRDLLEEGRRRADDL